MAATSTRPRLNGFINRIKLVGIELEGGWDVPPDGETIVKDGSVKFDPPQTVRAYEDQLPPSLQQRRVTAPVLKFPMPAFKGEIVGKPMPTDKFAGWLAHAYPKHVNATCGLHVHMSFHYRSNYARLMCPEFTPFIVQKVREFAEIEKLPKDHPQWDRVNKKDHRHCAHLYLAEGQAKATSKDYEGRGKPHSRYTFVNYCEAMHHTIEVRGLAMYETAEQAGRAILAVITGTNEFLSKLKHRETPTRIAVKPRAPMTQEFRSYLAA